eukprot:CAMPEP_0118631994 /NCGR_PEP_ID=MMETSP0785-20121206/202_1 /TAXON_ID=91992 /ORGANISM="Bolidomonas pacifica, Strain CCMP 1866" /LENGTH=82 /DNA_ID=CAMNT_0006522723 /DNA_START=180 /DNA_END=428 /DNA_ORIENTATION=+
MRIKMTPEVKEKGYFSFVESITKVKTNASSLTDDSVLTAADFQIPPSKSDVKVVYFYTPKKQWLDVIEFKPLPSPPPTKRVT